MLLVNDVFHTLHSELTPFAEIFINITPQDHCNNKIVL